MSHSGIHIAVALSVLLHAGLIAGWAPVDLQLPEIGKPTTSITAKLIANTSIIQPKTEEKRESRKTEHAETKPDHKLKQVSAKSPQPSKPAPPPPKEAAATTAPIAPDPEDQMNQEQEIQPIGNRVTKKTAQPASKLPKIGANSIERARIISRLKNALHLSIQYPFLARKRGWQGLVLLSFNLESNGLIKNIYVQQSSGYKLLDRSAINALRDISLRERFTGVPSGSDWALSVPVIYRLLDS